MLQYREDHPGSNVPAGPFIARLNGMLMTMLLELPGLEISNPDPAQWDIQLPAGSTRIGVERLWEWRAQCG